MGEALKIHHMLVRIWRKRSLVYYFSKYKFVYPGWKSVLKFFKCLEIEVDITYSTVVLRLSIYPRESILYYKDTMLAIHCF